MSNPTGDALHAAGLEDKGGAIEPISQSDTDSLRTSLLRMKKQIGSLFKRSATAPREAA